jgi:competence protein ComEC
MIWGGLATLTGLVFPPLGQLFAWVAWLFLSWTIGLVRFFANAPFAAVPISISPAGIVALYALIFGLTWYVRQSPERRSGLMAQFGQKLPRRVAFAGLAIVALLAAAWALSQPDGKLHISFLDVGQGDATFIQTPSGRTILIDGGQYPSVLNDHLGREIPFWDRSLDLVIATHPDEDHVAGIPGVLERYDVGLLLTNGQTAQEESYQALMDIATENAVPIHQAQAGEIIELGDGLRLEILNPTDPQSPIPDPQLDNDLSVALRLVYGDFSLLLTGDAGAAAEREMLASGRPLSAVVYKAGHHGAKTSNSETFLKVINPLYVIVSAGEGNNYGHPRPEFLDRAADIGAAVLRTDELGTIEVITDGEQLWWEARQ